MKDSYLSDEELKAFIATLPTRRLAAGALIRNERGEMLLVKPNYKDGWILPGGTVEAGEAPKPGCEREIAEELGLDVKLGRLLLIFHGLALGVWGDSTYYMYDGGVIAADTKITLQDAELVTYEWVAPENLEGYVRPSMVERLRECYRALETGETLELSNLDS